MRKIIVTISLLLGGLFWSNIPVCAGNDVPMTIIKEGEVSGQPTKNPQYPLVLFQEDNVLTIPILQESLVLQLLNENGVVVYSTLVPVGTTQVVLPTTLSGTYEIRLVAATYYYMGYIVL